MSTSTGGQILWFVGVLTAGLTAVYMFRMLFLAFHGAPRFDERAVHVHESPKKMLAPLVVLAILSVVGGWWAAPELFGGLNYFDRFLEPVFAAGAQVRETLSTAYQFGRMGAAVAIALIGFFVAWSMYIRRKDAAARVGESRSAIYRLLVGKYFVDEIYAAVIVRPLVWISRVVLWHGVDEGVIDGTVNGVGQSAQVGGSILRRVYSGNARSYATWVVLGAAALVTFLLWMGR
jgi:NADH-quinone oxidoreductase subunit L